MYGHKANVQKSPIYGVFVRFMGGSNVHQCIDKPQHGHKRRVISQAFSDNALRGIEDVITSAIDSFCQKLIDDNNGTADTRSHEHKASLHTRPWSSAKNVADLSDYLAFDIMGSLCFGKAFGMLDTDTNRYILETLRGATSGLHTVSKILVCLGHLVLLSLKKP